MKTLKTKITDEQIKLNYPWLGVAASGRVVLFHADRTGMILIEGDMNTYPVGTIRKDFIMSCFSSFNRSVIISN